MISASYESKLFIEQNNLQVKSTENEFAPSLFLRVNRLELRVVCVRIWNEHAILAKKRCIETI